MSFNQQHHYTTPMHQQQQMFNSSQHRIIPSQNMSFSESYANPSNINQQHVLPSPFTQPQSFYDNSNENDDVNSFRLHQPNVNIYIFFSFKIF